MLIVQTWWGNPVIQSSGGLEFISSINVWFTVQLFR